MSSASATASRSCSNSACFPGPCSGTRTSSSSASTSISASRTTGRTSRAPAKKGQVLRIPIAHFDGNYFAPEKDYADIRKNRRIVFRYCDADGKVTEEANVNGSMGAVAGIINEAGNVLGLMPHPERASEAVLGSEDGRIIFRSIVESMKKKTGARRLK